MSSIFCGKSRRFCSSERRRERAQKTLAGGEALFRKRIAVYAIPFLLLYIPLLFIIWGEMARGLVWLFLRDDWQAMYGAYYDHGAQYWELLWQEIKSGLILGGVLSVWLSVWFTIYRKKIWSRITQDLQKTLAESQ